MRAHLHSFAADLIGTALSFLVFLGYAAAVAAVVYGIVRVFELCSPDAVPEKPEDSL